MKGAIPFRGVPMAGIRKVVHDVWAEKGLAQLSVADRIEVALTQFQGRYSEDKVAGVLMLGELILEDLETDDVIHLARPFENELIWEWSTCDWYCVKVLGPFVAVTDRSRRARLIADWRDRPDLWQRRSAAVAFVNYAPQGEAFFEGFTHLLLEVCASNVQDPARFSQTSVGWSLRELSKAEPERVAAFVEHHQAQMSKEALRAATKHLRA